MGIDVVKNPKNELPITSPAELTVKKIGSVFILDIFTR